MSGVGCLADTQHNTLYLARDPSFMTLDEHHYMGISTNVPHPWDLCFYLHFSTQFINTTIHDQCHLPAPICECVNILHLHY